MGSGKSTLCNDKTCPIICVDAPVLNVHIILENHENERASFRTITSFKDTIEIHFFSKDMKGHTVCEWLAFILSPSLEHISQLSPNDKILTDLQSKTLEPTTLDTDRANKVSQVHRREFAGDASGYGARIDEKESGSASSGDDSSADDEGFISLRDATLYSLTADGQKNVLVLRVIAYSDEIEAITTRIQESLDSSQKKTWAKTFISPFIGTSISHIDFELFMDRNFPLWVDSQMEDLPWTRKAWRNQRREETKRTSAPEGKAANPTHEAKLPEPQKDVARQQGNDAFTPPTRGQLLKAAGVATLAAGAYGAHRAGLLPTLGGGSSAAEAEEATTEAMASLSDATRIVDAAGSKGLSATKVKELSKTLDEATSALVDFQISDIRSQYSA